MRFMLDTNVVIDILTSRDGYEDSLQVVKACELGIVEGFVSAITVNDIMYILRKHMNPKLIRETVKSLLLIVDVASVTKSDISSAFASEMNDFEDAVQSSCAERMKVDYIVTRNGRDFANSTIAAVSPYDALRILQ